MRPILIDRPADWPTARIYPVYDVHVGAPEFDERAFCAYVERVAADPCGLVVLGGDLIDNATKSSVGNGYDATMSPMRQKIRVAEMLAPVADRVIAVVEGNHEYRTARESGQCVTYDICTKLNVEDKYRENMAFVKLRFGRNATSTSNGRLIVYTLLITHGSGGGMYVGSTLNKTENYLTMVEGVDVMITGHAHKQAVTRPARIVFDAQRGTVAVCEVLNVVCGAWMDYGGYAQRKLLKPGSKGAPVVTLSGARKEFGAAV